MYIVHVHKARVSERGREGGAGEKERGEYERKGERQREREREGGWGARESLR